MHCVRNFLNLNSYRIIDCVCRYSIFLFLLIQNVVLYFYIACHIRYLNINVSCLGSEHPRLVA